MIIREGNSLYIGFQEDRTGKEGRRKAGRVRDLIGGFQGGGAKK
jgi:hypothetical protein